jgi:hypothetical protein
MRICFEMIDGKCLFLLLTHTHGNKQRYRNAFVGFIPETGGVSTRGPRVSGTNGLKVNLKKVFSGQF